MKKHKIEYLVSAVQRDQWPPATHPEVVLVGRSNSGKSSLINALWGHPVAFVSGQPGRTNVLNFYRVGELYRVVDSPGYGFAKKRTEIQAGFKGIGEYIEGRDTLKGLLIVMDVRRDLEDEEIWLLDFCTQHSIPRALLLNKIDKLNQKERNQHRKKIEEQLKEFTAHMFLVSAEGKDGLGELESWIFKNWIKPQEEKQ